MKKIILTLAVLVCAMNVNAQYKVGDIYNENGLKGMVVKVEDGGAHGLIMSLNFYTKKWLADDEARFETEAFYEDDGQKNMDVIEKYIQTNNMSWSDFPIFEWAKSLGEGWYIPAKDELLEIGKNLNGGSLTYNFKTMKNWSKIIKKNGGDELVDTGFSGSDRPRNMYSSTEAEGGMVYTLWLKQKTGSIILQSRINKPKGTLEVIPMNKKHSGGKMGGAGSRAVHKF